MQQASPDVSIVNCIAMAKCDNGKAKNQNAKNKNQRKLRTNSSPFRGLGGKKLPLRGQTKRRCSVTINKSVEELFIQSPNQTKLCK
jgi:hypothetical protein